MTRTLVLHQRSAMALPAAGFVAAAARLDCAAVSLFAHCPDVVLPGQAARLVYPAIGGGEVRGVRARLDDLGLRVAGAEYFPILRDVDVAGYAPALEIAAALGARRAMAHVHERDAHRAADAIRALCDLAAPLGMGVSVEFCPMTHGCRSLAEARRLVALVGDPRFTIAVDCLHLIRSGGTAGDVAALDPATIGAAQLCDAHGTHQADAYIEEVGDRLIAGKGDLPLAAILAAIPPTLPIEIEAPSRRIGASEEALLDHLRRAVDAARAFAVTLEPAR